MLLSFCDRAPSALTAGPSSDSNRYSVSKTDEKIISDIII
jgi:hypothetical protein